MFTQCLSSPKMDVQRRYRFRMRKFCKYSFQFCVSTKSALTGIRLCFRKVKNWAKSVKEMDPLQLTLSFLEQNCRFGLIPYNFNEATSQLGLVGGRRIILWYCLCLIPLLLKGLSVLALPLAGQVKFRPIGNDVTGEDMNMIVYFCFLPYMLFFIAIVPLFIREPGRVARLLAMYLELETQFSRKQLSYM